uniref:Uncharacterized protein n=1 Tax=Rhizophora mucronata TaxID=61149 RepID=A0A2P2L639_RHIMU
MSLDLIPFFGR